MTFLIRLTRRRGVCVCEVLVIVMSMVSNNSQTQAWSNVEFGLFVCGEALAFPCYVFVMYHLLATRAARKVLHNHPVVVMLLLNWLHLAIDLSMTLNHLRLGYVWLFSPILCLIQQFVDTGVWYGAIFLMLWISIERHILIFHNHLVATPRRRLLFHYVPLIIFLLYAPTFYFYLIFFFPCARTFDIHANLCGGACYYFYRLSWLNWYESIANYVIPILLIVAFNGGLFVRIGLQKRRVQQSPNWRRNQKMIMQLFAVSSVYLIFDLPYIIITIVQWSGRPDFGSHVLTPYIAHLTYVPAVVLPFATFVTLPQLKQKLFALLFCSKYRVPTVIPRRGS